MSYVISGDGRESPIGFYFTRSEAAAQCVRFCVPKRDPTWNAASAGTAGHHSAGREVFDEGVGKVLIDQQMIDQRLIDRFDDRF